MLIPFVSVIRVTWVDVSPSSETGWLEKDDIEKEFKKNDYKSQRSTGYYCGETKDLVGICQDVNTKSVNDFNVIPKKMIISINEIYKDKES